nr:protein 4c [Infectious bronchitis virus]
MEKSTTKESPSFKKVVVDCGRIIRKIKPPTTLIFNKGILCYKQLNKYRR